MFLPIVIYLELFIALFFLPGFFITVIFGMKKFRFLLSFALSYSLLVLTLLPFEYYGQPIICWQWCIFSAWVILATTAVVKMFMSWSSKTLNIQRSTSNSEQENMDPMLKVQCWMLKVAANLIHRLFNPRLMVPLALAVVICGYLAYAGPYLEIPADAWEHLRRFKWFETGAIENGFFAPGSSVMGLLAQRLRWYFIHAWLCHVAGLPVIDSLHVLTFVNVLVFLLAIYYFGLFLFAGLRATAFKKMTMAAFASLFAAVTMGNMVFAYIRYYAFAPTILNYVLFLSAMAVIIAWLRSSRWFGHAFWIVPILLFVTGLIHMQESLFIFFMTLALSLVETVRVLWRKIFRGEQYGDSQNVLCDITDEIRGNRWVISEWKIIILAAVLLVVFFAGFAATRYFKPGAWISASMIMPNVGLPSEPVSFIFRDLIITPPSSSILRLAAYQLFIFYQVIGCWGLFVYLLFLLMIRRFIKMPYLAAGMIIVPLLTTFNPFTVDMIARLGQDPTIYRFYYLIPLPFVGGYLFVHFWDKVRAWRRWAWFDLPGSILVLAGLIGLVFPINAAGIHAPYSKFYTLRKIPAGNDYRLYADLGKFIAQYDNKVILSDGWTAGFLWFYSPKNTYGWLTWFSSLNPEKDQPVPYTWEDLRGRGLIVVNCRDGAPSITGKIARHWPEDILKTSHLYSLEARRYLESHPEKFQKIWSQDLISVYSVR